MIRRKVSCYLGSQINALSPSTSKMMASSLIKKNKQVGLRELPPMTNLQQLLKQEDTYYHLYKERIDRGMEDCAYCTPA